MADNDIAPTGNIIEVEDLRRSYGRRGKRRFEAVRGVTFSIRRGELFALLGTNGAGKTSTLEVLEGVAPPTSGRVRVLGHDPYRGRHSLRPHIGIMLQDGGFPADLTVAEIGRLWAGTLALARPVEEALDLVDLRHRNGVLIRQLSSGEKRRLDLALAILGRPGILFLDEPTAGLDPVSRERAWELIRNLLGSGCTVMLTTHYLQEAEELADRVAILHRGRIARSGSPAEMTGSQPTRICFTLPALAPEVVPDLPGAVGIGNRTGATGRTVTVHTEAMQRTLAALLGWAGSHGVTLTDLDVRRATLTEAFLAVAGSEANDTDETKKGELAA